VHQGDQHVVTTNTIYVDTAYFTLQDELELNKVRASAPTKRRADEAFEKGHDSSKSSKKRCIRFHNSTVSIASTAPGHAAAQPVRQCCSRPSSPTHDCADLPTQQPESVQTVYEGDDRLKDQIVEGLMTRSSKSSDALSAPMRSVNTDMHTSHPCLAIFFQRIRDILYHKHSPNVDLRAKENHGYQVVSDVSALKSSCVTSATPNTSATPLQQLAALCMFVFTCLAYRNVPSKDVSKVLS